MRIAKEAAHPACLIGRAVRDRSATREYGYEGCVPLFPSRSYLPSFDEQTGRRQCPFEASRNEHSATNRPPQQSDLDEALIRAAAVLDGEPLSIQGSSVYNTLPRENLGAQAEKLAF